MAVLTYNIVYKGKILNGHDFEAVKARLVKEFGLTLEKAEQLLKSKRVTIKKNLDQADAQKYGIALKKAGLHVVMTKYTPSDEPQKPAPGNLTAETFKTTSPEEPGVKVTEPEEPKAINKMQNDDGKVDSDLIPFEAEPASYSDNFDSDSHSEIFNTLKKYYGYKHYAYQGAINFACRFSSPGSVSNSHIENQIKGFASLTNDPNNYDDDDEPRRFHRNLVQFYKDILRFRDYFSDKGIKLTSNDVLNIFKEVDVVCINNDHELTAEKLIDTMKQELGDEFSNQDVRNKHIEKEIKYNYGDYMVDRVKYQLINGSSWLSNWYDDSEEIPEVDGDGLFDFIKQRLGGKLSEENIIREYYLYSSEIGASMDWFDRWRNHLQSLFSQFNFSYDNWENGSNYKLDNTIRNMIVELSQEWISYNIEHAIYSNYGWYSDSDEPVHFSPDDDD